VPEHPSLHGTTSDGNTHVSASSAAKPVRPPKAAIRRPLFLRPQCPLAEGHFSCSDPPSLPPGARLQLCAPRHSAPHVRAPRQLGSTTRPDRQTAAMAGMENIEVHSKVDTAPNTSGSANPPSRTSFAGSTSLRATPSRGASSLTRSRSTLASSSTQAPPPVRRHTCPPPPPSKPDPPRPRSKCPPRAVAGCPRRAMTGQSCWRSCQRSG
jgi:hypothetical protein